MYGKSVAQGHTYNRCYVTHKPLKILDFEIFGGSCIQPHVVDADIYVGFDVGMRFTKRSYPWMDGEEFMYPISDGGVPQDVDSFRTLLTYLSRSLQDGHKVHCGCIGGHGRTGLVLSALVTTMTGVLDSITYVRDGYCPKAVESDAQVKFLVDHFGITKAPPSKTPVIYDFHGDRGGEYLRGGGIRSASTRRKLMDTVGKSRDRLDSIWDSTTVLFDKSI